jgi:hypothetical protein
MWPTVDLIRVNTFTLAVTIVRNHLLLATEVGVILERDNHRIYCHI